MKNKFLLTGLFILLHIVVYGQMKSAEYPFCFVDHAIYNKKGLFVDINSKPHNFISTYERWYFSDIGLNIIDSANSFVLIDSVTLQVNINSKNTVIDNAVQRINEIHRETNSRAFIAGFTNNSKDTISLPVQDASLIAILEAKNKSGKWNPIQFWPISGCGNSYYSPKLFPGESIQFTVDNNFGMEKTLMRLRLHGNDTIYISNEFQGTVNQDIFDKSNNQPENFDYILCDSIFYLEKPLFGEFNLNLDFDVELDDEQ